MRAVKTLTGFTKKLHHSCTLLVLPVAVAKRKIGGGGTVGFDPRESVTVLIELAKSLGQILVNEGSILVKN